MSEKKPDTPVVHLPWSHWQDITARLDALEAAVFSAWREGAAATRSALAGYADARGATTLADAMRDFPLPPIGGERSPPPPRDEPAGERGRDA